MIVLFFRNPDSLSDSRLDELLALLPPQQQQIVDQIHLRRHRCEQVVAYTMLCNALAYESEHLSGDDIVLKEVEEHQLAMPLIDPPLWRFGEQGKPFITNYENCHFNISHCTQAVTVAVASRNVGVDVEGPRRFNEGLLQRSMSPTEQAEIRQSSNPEATFSKLWTRKEAYFKWLGTGILITRLPFTEEDAAQAQCHIETQYVDVADFFLSLAFKISS